MASVLIIGCGNPLRCDDGMAWRVAEALSLRQLPPEVKIMVQHQLTPELAVPVSQAQAVIFLDAACEGRPGELRREAVSPGPAAAAFSHEFSPAALLGLARELYGRSPEACAITLCGACFDHGEGLSVEVQAGLPQVVAMVLEQVQSALPAREEREYR
jgi:hydrogenase maturation protease